MARYRIAKDGHRFLTHGYAILDKQARDDVHFSTYQVNTGGEQVFDRAGFKDGHRVSEETFFALLLDGDLYNDARPNGIAAEAIPNRVLAYMDAAVRQYQLDQFTFEGKVYLADILEKLRLQFKNEANVLPRASWLCIYRYWKAHAKTLQASVRNVEHVHRDERVNITAIQATEDAAQPPKVPEPLDVQKRPLEHLAATITLGTKSYPAFGQKTTDYPFGYGRCQCGCNKITQMARTQSLPEWVWTSYLDGHEPKPPDTPQSASHARSRTGTV